MASVTIYDVAARAGVSIKTVSRVMNKEPNVRPAMRDRVLEAAARETALRRVLAKIKRVKRRSLALEKILIPRLQSQESRIRLELEERGREEFVRLKKRKRQ